MATETTTVAAPAAAPPTSAPAAPPTATPAATPKPGAEPTKTPAAGAPEKPPPSSKAWADLGIKERGIAAREEKLKAGEVAIAAREAAIAEGGTKAEKERIKKLIAEKRFDDLETEFGFNYSDWTKAKLAKGAKSKDEPAKTQQGAALTADAVAKLVAEGIAKDREERAAAETKQHETGAAEHWKKTMGEVASLVKEGGDKYSMIGNELAYRAPYIEETLREMAALDPTIDRDVALDKLEGFMLKRTADLVRSSPKLLALIGGSSANPATGAQPKNEQQSSPRERTGHEASGDGPRTLTNVLAADGAPSAPPATRPLSKAAKVMAEREEGEANLRRIAAKLNE